VGYEPYDDEERREEEQEFKNLVAQAVQKGLVRRPIVPMHLVFNKKPDFPISPEHTYSVVQAPGPPIEGDDQ
jgi:hypothetical protein